MPAPVRTSLNLVTGSIEVIDVTVAKHSRTARVEPSSVERAPGTGQTFRLPYGPFLRMSRDPLSTWMDALDRYGDVFRFDFGRIPIHFFFHPDHAQHVLQDNMRNYPRSIVHRLIALATGNGLLSTQGEEWRRDRRICQPAFNRQQVHSFAPIAVDTTRMMLDEWAALAARGETIELGSAMMTLTLRIIGQALFSRDLSMGSDEFGQATSVAVSYITHRVTHPLAPPLKIPTPRNLRFKRNVRTVDRMVQDMIVERRQAAEPPNDLLSALVAARDEETGQALSDRKIRDHIVTFLGAGHETTANAMTWTLALLAHHPDINRRVRDEVHRVIGGDRPTVEHLPQLTLTRNVINESMRLYPPVPIIIRGVDQEDTVGGYRIPGQSFAVVTPYVTQRHPEFWSEPERFHPDRPELASGRHETRFAFFPFSSGPRKCIGDEFAMMEMLLTVAVIVDRFDLHPVADRLPDPEIVFTLRPKSEIHVRLADCFQTD